MYSGIVQFADTEQNDTCKYLYGYLADDELAFLFYGEKEMAEEVGIRCTLRVDGDVYHIKRKCCRWQH